MPWYGDENLAQTNKDNQRDVLLKLVTSKLELSGLPNELVVTPTSIVMKRAWVCPAAEGYTEFKVAVAQNRTDFPHIIYRVPGVDDENKGPFIEHMGNLASYLRGETHGLLIDRNHAADQGQAQPFTDLRYLHLNDENDPMVNEGVHLGFSKRTFEQGPNNGGGAVAFAIKVDDCNTVDEAAERISAVVRRLVELGNAEKNLPALTLPRGNPGDLGQGEPPGQDPGDVPKGSEPAWAGLLEHNKCIVLEGVPGTGKTHSLGWFQNSPNWVFEPDQAITFHPSTSYEDFVEGLRPNPRHLDLEDEPPTVSDGSDGWFFEPPAEVQNGWGIQDGFFLRVCAKALRQPTKKFIVLLDELNRANVPRVFGDLLTTVETSKRAVHTDDGWEVGGQPVTLPYSGRKFFVPENVYLIATMNTTDQSVAPLDAALRRRFWFVRMEPEAPSTNEALPAFKKSVVAWKAINAVLEKKIGPDAMLGHSYLYGMKAARDDDAISKFWQYDLLPQLIDSVRSNHALDQFGTDGELASVLKRHFGGDSPISLQGDGLSRRAVIANKVAAPVAPVQGQVAGAAPQGGDDDMVDEGEITAPELPAIEDEQANDPADQD